MSYEGIGVLALVACVTGILVHRPQRPAYLWWLVAAICFHLAGDAVLLVYDLRATTAPFPSIADFVYLGGYASVVVSMILLVRRRERPVSSDVLDALIVLVGSALLFWFTLVEPFARGAGSNVSSKLVAAAYPSADVLLVVAVSQLVLSAGTRSTSFRLIAVGTLFLLGTDVVYGLESLRGLYAPGGWLDAGWMISLVLFGVAVLHPSISALDSKTPVHDTRLTWQRLALLGVALLITPIVFAVYSGPADSVDLVIIVAAGTLTTLLVVARMALLFREHTRAIVALRDAAAQREVEQALRSANVRFEAAAQALECAIYEWNPETEEVLWTEGLTSVFQHPVDRRGSPNSWFMDQVHPDDRAEAHRLRRGGGGRLASRTEASYRFRAGDGTYRYVWDRWIAIKDADGAVSRIVGGLVDVTDRHGLELLLQQSQKMEAVGQLAGGIAHDFNNLLLAISGNAELLQDSPTLRPQDQEDVREIVKAAGRAADLTSQLLTFSRPDLHELGSVDLNSTVAGIETLLKRVLGENIEIATSLEPHAPAVLGTASGIEQIVVNLAVNARDAMPAGGHLRISTQLEPGGAHVRLVVEDTGEGMDEATAARVFEPFFTTKEVGKGTGLGLATVYGIVDQFGGTIALASRPGEGTRFDVLLPFSESRPAVVSPVVPAAGGGSERILLVEDEAPVRAVVTKMLAAHGYAVVSADDPIEALELLARGEFLPDLIVSDLVMPGMSGVAFAKRVESLHPGLRFLFISGYSGHSALEDDSRLEQVQVIQKPFAAGELTRAVREALDARSGASHAVV